MKTSETCVVSENPTERFLPTDEELAEFWLSGIPNLGDMIIRLDGKAMTRLEMAEVVDEVLGLLDEGAIGCILAAREDGTWASLGRYGFFSLDFGQDGCWVGLPDSTGWEPPRVDERRMVPVEEVLAARDRARSVFKLTGKDKDLETYRVLGRRLTAERAAHALNCASPHSGDLCAIVYGEPLLRGKGEEVLVDLFESGGVMSCEIGLGDGRWTAYDPVDMLDVVRRLHLLKSQE